MKASVKQLSTVNTTTTTNSDVNSDVHYFSIF